MQRKRKQAKKLCYINVHASCEFVSKIRWTEQNESRNIYVSNLDNFQLDYNLNIIQLQIYLTKLIEALEALLV